MKVENSSVRLSLKKWLPPWTSLKKWLFPEHLQKEVLLINTGRKGHAEAVKLFYLRRIREWTLKSDIHAEWVGTGTWKKEEGVTILRWQDGGRRQNTFQRMGQSSHSASEALEAAKSWVGKGGSVEVDKEHDTAERNVLLFLHTGTQPSLLFPMVLGVIWHCNSLCWLSP